MHAAAGLREPSRRVSPRARTMWVLTSVVEAALVLGVMIVVGPVLDWLGLPWWLFAIVGGAGAAYVVVVPPWRYAVHRWEVTDTAVYTQKGWWSLERRIAPMSRIQTVDLAEGPVARLFRLATVTVTTASAAGALEIEGLDRDLARALVEELTVKADADTGDAT